MYKIVQMSEKEAEQIIHWHYTPPYDLYNMGGSNEVMAELLIGDYYAVYEDDTLAGFYCYGQSAQVPIPESKDFYRENHLDFGLGMAPILCGKGLGFDFMRHGLDYGLKEHQAETFRLTVAAFNLRGIKTYTKLGFRQTGAFKRKSDGQVFIVMVR